MTTTTKAPPTDTGACGTNKGRQRHRARRENPCRPCLDAANEMRSRGKVLLRDARAKLDAQPVPEWIGRLAGWSTPHNFVPMSVSQCGWCFGWRDDPRHPVVGGPVVGR